MARRRTYIDFSKSKPVCTTGAVAQIAVTDDNAVNFWHADGHTLEVSNTAANADIIPTWAYDSDADDGDGASGWRIPLDNTDNDGIEITQGISTVGGRPGAFTVGTDAFRLFLKFSHPDVSAYDVCAVGFRKAAAYGDIVDPSASLQSAVVYTDFAYLNVEAGDFRTHTTTNQTGGGTGTATETDVTVTDWADDEAHKIELLCDAAGAVTYKVDGTAVSDAVAFSFDSGDIVIPSILFTKGSGTADEPILLMEYFCGLQ